MATPEQLEQALRNAHNAGDENAARALAAELQKVRSAAAPQQDHQSAFDELPWYLKATQAADDTARRFANTITLGGADRLASYMGGTPLEEEHRKSEEATERAGSAAIGTDILAMAAPANAISKGIGAAVPALRGMGNLATGIREGLTGAAIGGGMSIGQGEDVGSGMLTGAIGGSLGGVAGNYVARGIDKIASRLGIGKGVLASNRTPRMDVASQTAAKNAAYQNVDEAGIAYAPDDLQGLVGEMRRRLSGANIDRTLHPRSTRVFRNMNQRFNRGKPASIGAVDQARQVVVRDATGPGGENEMGRLMRESLDQFIDTTKPVGGGTARARELIGTAREANRKLSVREAVEKAQEIARNSAGGENNINPFRNLLNSGTKGMTDKEIELLKNVVRGSGWEEQLARITNSAAGRFGTLGSGAAAGGILGGPTGGVVGGLGAMTVPPLAKRAVGKYTRQNIEALLDAVGGGSFDPSMLRRLLPAATGGAAASGTVEQNARNRRKRRRNRRD